jgi:hypothetical protein
LQSDTGIQPSENIQDQCPPVVKLLQQEIVEDLFVHSHRNKQVGTSDDVRAAKTFRRYTEHSEILPVQDDILPHNVPVGASNHRLTSRGSGSARGARKTPAHRGAVTVSGPP